MSRRFDLPGLIPVFPLPGALLLPRSRLPLHIFEPRYLAMLEDALKTETRIIGMIQPDPLSGSDKLRESRGEEGGGAFRHGGGFGGRRALLIRSPATGALSPPPQRLRRDIRT